MSTSGPSEAALQQLAELWPLEKLAARRQERELRDSTPFAERVRRGVALKGLRHDFGAATPSFGAAPELMFFDAGLNDSQRQAVGLAMRAKQIALIHGPPGTGKTRTLVEVIRQQLFAGRRIWVTAASNAAIDHLIRQLVAAKQGPLRLGHSARVSVDLRAHTSDAKMEKLADHRMARRWQAEA